MLIFNNTETGCTACACPARLGPGLHPLSLCRQYRGLRHCLGIYVYRDAKSRGMNAPLWTLIAVLAPVFVGLIIYLLVRGSYSDLKCPNCAAPVTEQFRSCPSCAAPVEPDWKVCPHCGNPLSEVGAVWQPYRWGST